MKTTSPDGGLLGLDTQAMTAKYQRFSAVDVAPNERHMLTTGDDDLSDMAFEVLEDADEAVGTLRESEYQVVLVMPSMQGICMTPEVARMVAARLLVAAEKADREAEDECDCGACEDDRLDSSLN
jgi:hypothetical protein